MINGKKVGVLIDTGAYATLLTKTAAERLELPTRSTSQVIMGVGGSESRMLVTRLDELKIGDFSAKGLQVRVAGENPFEGVDLVLGQDFLQNVDIEFDYANGAVRLFQPARLQGQGAGLLGSGRAAAAALGQPPGRHSRHGEWAEGRRAHR